MSTPAEDIQAQIDALDARILVVAGQASASYSIDGQSVTSGAADLKALIEAKKLLLEQLSIIEGPWELEDRVIT